jgi:ssDNA-binding Zn-finger/Zn-ribbon topoisomerase 1
MEYKTATLDITNPANGATKFLGCNDNPRLDDVATKLLAVGATKIEAIFTTHSPDKDPKNNQFTAEIYVTFKKLSDAAFTHIVSLGADEFKCIGHHKFSLWWD